MQQSRKPAMPDKSVTATTVYDARTIGSQRIRSAQSDTMPEAQRRVWLQNAGQLAVAAIATGLSAAWSKPALAQSGWPTRPLRWLVPTPPGSSVDVLARVTAERLKERLAQPVIVENKPGAGGTLAGDLVAKAAADGYTFFFGFNGPLALAPELFRKLPYDPQRDFSPVILCGSQPNVLVVPAGLGVQNLDGFLAMARSKPGALNYASVGNGSASHLTMELLKTDAKVFITHIPYNGGPAATQAVVAGDVQALWTAPSNVLAMIRSGRLKALAVTSGERTAALPDVPTMTSLGWPQLETLAWNGLVAPAGTPKDIIDRLNQAMNQVYAMADVRQRLAGAGIDAGGGTPEALGKLMHDERRKWAPVIRRTGAAVD